MSWYKAFSIEINKNIKHSIFYREYEKNISYTNHVLYMKKMTKKNPFHVKRTYIKRVQKKTPPLSCKNDLHKRRRGKKKDVQIDNLFFKGMRHSMCLFPFFCVARILTGYGKSKRILFVDFFLRTFEFNPT